ncbi:cold-shock protein [Paracoccaceae bacterium GXU_MW_L88]
MVFGRVKWFDAELGYGFVDLGDGSGDVLLHANILRGYGRSSVVEGAEIEFELKDTARGRQVAEVFNITANMSETVAFMGDSAAQISPSDLDESEPARVKWFDKARGFGFVNVFGSSEDVFVHKEVLRAAGLADLQPGEAIAVRTCSGDRGRLAVAIFPWDALQKKNEDGE